MPRLHIELPAAFSYRTSVAVRIGDINRAGHLGHVNLVSILEEARARYMISHGFENEVHISGHRSGFILGDLGVIFKRQGYYGQTLDVEIEAVDFAEKSFDLVYRVREQQNGQELARAKTTILVFDFQLQKVIPITDELKQQLTV